MPTEPQKTALANPCRLGFEAAQPQFAWNLADVPGASLVLTINSGYE